MLMKAEGIYHGISPQQDEPDGRIRALVTGRNLAHARRSVLERAFVAADLHLNRIELVSPTVKQCAYLASVCVPYATAAIEIADDQAARNAVFAGELTLLEAAKAAVPESLAEHFMRTSPSEWLKCARTIGPEVIWNRMISPLV